MSNRSNGYALDDSQNTSALLLKCVEDERIDVLRLILSQISSKPDFHEVIDSNCCVEGTLLHYAISRGYIDSVRVLLSSGVSPCVQNDQNQTAYQVAMDDDIKRAFVEELLHASAQSNLGRVCQMISAGVPVDAVDALTTGNTALHWAASFGTSEVVGTLCESGANVNIQNAKGETPLHDAVRRGDEAVVRCLLSNGADANIKDSNNVDCFELAMKLGGSMLNSLSLNNVTRNIHRSASADSDFDRCSILSTETAHLFTDRTASFSSSKIESWHDLLWPQPKYLNVDPRNQTVRFPSDNRLKVYFDGASEGEPQRIMQAMQISASFLSSIGLELEYRGHKIAEHSSLDGKITCGIFDNGEGHGSYTLSIEPNGIDFYAADYSGIRYGFSTLIQILRLHKAGSRSMQIIGDDEISIDQLSVNATSSIALSSSISGEFCEEFIPCVTIRDSPDMHIRAVFQDFSGCKILNAETLLQLATRIGYCKANYLFINFEVRSTDRYQLPYTNRDLFHMAQVCDELFVKLVPSIDVQSSYIELSLARRIIESFLDDFPLTKVVHFGWNLSSILITEKSVLEAVRRRVSRIFLSVEVDHKNAPILNRLPPYVTICIDGRFPFEAESLLSSRLNVVLKFSTNEIGYLCSAPDSIAKKAILAAKLGEKFPLLGIMVSDLSTGCEIMPLSLAYMSEISTLGVCWNRSVDMRRFCFLLPKLTAEHMLLDRSMEIVFKQASTLGRVEHEITKFCHGSHKSSSELNREAMIPMAGKSPISIFVEMILNPDNMVLDKLTPVIFKKARIELRRSLKALTEAGKSIPYNFELALVLAEVQLVTELVVLACRLGQSLCSYGINPSMNGSSDRKFSISEQKNVQENPPLLDYALVNFGIANLPLTVRTDLANNLLTIRSRFQHIWLSRNIPSTLPNALKIFDNLFRALLPPSLQEYEKSLL